MSARRRRTPAKVAALLRELATSSRTVDDKAREAESIDPANREAFAVGWLRSQCRYTAVELAAALGDHELAYVEARSKAEVRST